MNKLYIYETYISIIFGVQCIICIMHLLLYREATSRLIKINRTNRPVSNSVGSTETGI